MRDLSRLGTPRLPSQNEVLAWERSMGWKVGAYEAMLRPFTRTHDMLLVCEQMQTHQGPHPKNGARGLVCVASLHMNGPATHPL